MREQLAVRDQERFRIVAKVEKYSYRPGWRFREPTILLTDVRDANTGKLLTDHLWFKSGLWSRGCRVGDTISFDARVSSYKKNKGRKKDWNMQRPTKVINHSLPI